MALVVLVVCANELFIHLLGDSLCTPLFYSIKILSLFFEDFYQVNMELQRRWPFHPSITLCIYLTWTFDLILLFADVTPNEPRMRLSLFCRSSAGWKSTESRSGCSVTLCPVSALDWSLSCKVNAYSCKCFTLQYLNVRWRFMFFFKPNWHNRGILTAILYFLMLLTNMENKRYKFT